MRVHFIAVDLEQVTENSYRIILTQTWNDIRPDRHSYANLLSNRVRWLLEEEKFTQIELDAIRNSCYPRGAVLGLFDDPPETTSTNSQEERPRNSKLEGKFIKNLLMYSGIPAENRPRIPKLRASRIVMKKVDDLDKILDQKINHDHTIEEIVDCVYAAALTVCGEMGVDIREVQKNKSSGPPPWKHRLEGKINEMRKKSGILQTYLNAESPSLRILKLTHRIASDAGVKAGREHFKQQMILVSEKLKQKIKILGNRIRRYNERVKRYKNNKLYHQNQQKFFRSLEDGPSEAGEPPREEAMHFFWKGIWEVEKTYDSQASWIKEAEKESSRYSSENVEITVEDIKSVLRRTNNWSSPGVDGIQNYWWKHFMATHQHLAKIFQQTLKDPTKIPHYFTQGNTIMIPKGETTQDPERYRPITCLPTVYKILTGVLTRHISRHVSKNNIPSKEQGGCRGDTRGCKELLITDYVIAKQVKKKQRSISVAWVDYKKAFDSVPHSWLIKILEIYGVPQAIIDLLKYLMKTWRTNLIVNTKNEHYKTGTINIKSGIFQGDTLSPLWFCLAMNLLSQLINRQKYGYIVERSRNIKISHQMYIDDLKLYAANEEEMKKLLRIVASFTKTIGMEIGMDKCAVVHVRRGQIREGEGLAVMEDLTIPRLSAQEHYKYLGIQQALDIKMPEMKNIFREKYFTRVKKILQSKLNAKAMFMSMNRWALPCLSYSFGVIKWTAAELKELDIKTRALLTRHGIHHPHASSNRLYIRRQEGGRGLQNIEKTYNETIVSMREYFHAQNSPLLQAICRSDENLSALNLSSRERPVGGVTEVQLIREWHGKALHGRYPGNLEKNNINKKESLTYLRAGYLYPETEGRLISIQDQVVPTRSYIKNITGRNIPTDRCRRCLQGTESIQHVVSSCSLLAPTDYTERHNAMARVFHRAIAEETGLIKTAKKAYEYTPCTVLENDTYKLYWDMVITTDKPIPHNRPDIVLFDKGRRSAKIMDVTVPADDNISKAFTEKLTKYQDLAFELKTTYDLRSVVILPLIISTSGLVEAHLEEYTLMLGLQKELISTAQKQVILATTRIVRKFLSTS
ncbi:uncharacterized protein LOC123673305 [Harmonia axyridis]|uniref:uncharacterized protein LOC123673305 n=1 Tax=Harmonia axyridis TaxID=115357 RepID=UPI001E2787B9|nr:uncharacterized protein LOC123673305 [Harmonia axyridis]